MATSKSNLKANIKTELEAVFGVADDPNTLDKFAQAISNAVVDELRAADVSSNGATAAHAAGAPANIVNLPGVVS